MDVAQVAFFLIGISRGKNFDQDVRLEFSEPPQGLKIEPGSKAFKASDKDVQVNLVVAPDAALGHHDIRVTGTPVKSGAKGTAMFKVEIKKAD